MSLHLPRNRLLFLGDDWVRRALSTRPSNLVGLWLLDESSGTVAYDRGPQRNNGVITGMTLGQPGPISGHTSMFDDGLNNFVNIYSAALASAFNGAAGTVLAWVKVANAGVWTDGTSRWAVRLSVDASNRVTLFARVGTSNNTAQFVYTAGGTNVVVENTDFGGLTDWIPVAITWDKAADQMKAYGNGVQTGTTQTGLGTWVGSLASTSAVIGALITTPTNVWSGWIGPVALYSTALNAAEIAQWGRRS